MQWCMKACWYAFDSSAKSEQHEQSPGLPRPGMGECKLSGSKKEEGDKDGSPDIARLQNSAIL